ncbi:MAG: hypothetical protein ABI867_10355 [Kofleriaceae bacterium]
MRFLIVLCLVVACEKAGPAASGDLTTDEKSVLANLPRDADFAFGGNFLRLQKYLQSSPLGKVMSAMDSIAPGMKKWTDCLGEYKDVQMLGTVEASSSVEMRFVMTHITLDDIEKCAKTAEFAATMDADRKFIAIQIPGGLATKLGYLAIPGGIYGKQTMKVALPKLVADPPERARFEADIAAAQKENASQNPTLQAAIAKVDRTKAMWFAGSATATPLGNKLGEMFGSLDFGDGLKIDVVADLKDPKLGEKIMTGFSDAKEASGMLGSEVKSILNAVKITLDSGKLRVRIELTNAQLETVMSKLGPMMGGMRGLQPQ